MSTVPTRYVEFDVFDPASRSHADPYPSYQRVRETGALVPFLLGDVPVHLVTRYEECAALLLSPDWGHGYTAGISPFRDTMALIPGVFLRFDPPEHDRLRAVVNKAFTPRAVSGYAAAIDSLVDELVDKAVRAGELDVLADLAIPLALALVAGKLLGAPLEDGPTLRDWEFAIARGTDPDCWLSSDEIARRAQAGKGAFAYFGDLAARRGQSEENLIDVLLAACARQAMSMPEVVGVAMFTLVAGVETSINLIGQSIHSLLRNPGQLALLRERPELIPAAVDEVLRWDPPTQFTMRVALNDTVVGGHEFARGDAVVILTASAGRDEAVYTTADQFDITRYSGPRPSARRHLAFGLGLHYCIGAPLARMEAHAAIGALLARTRNLELVTETLTYQPTLIHRGLASLPVKLTI